MTTTTNDRLGIAYRWFHALPSNPDDIAATLNQCRCAGQRDHALDNPLSIQCYLETGVWPMIGDRHFAVEHNGALVEAITPFHVVAFLALFDLGRYPALIGTVTNTGRNT